MRYSKVLRGLLAAMLAAAAGVAQAQQAGARLLVGYPAGGAPDAVARVFAEHLRQVAGIPVVVENRAGATGKLAIDAVQAAPADGQTLMVMPASSLLLTPMVLKSANYDAVRDFAPVSALAEYGFGVALGPAAQGATLAEFMAWAKGHADQANYATPGLGTPQHFLGAELARQGGTPLTHVPYRGGANAVTDVLGGQVAALITTEQLLVPYQAQGKLRAVLITSPQRNAKLPGVPTAREAGLPQLEAVDWFGLFVKAGTPADRLAEWQARADAVLASPAYRKAVADLGYALPGRPTAGLGPRLERERGQWSDRMRVSGFKATE
ncbi:tripartite tricarboxylate transporter substrate-binding protein [Pigmentiphaga kullae]|uniref:Tripartite-type tricarboxylate transporter receptor subunit TctC n=1 Tax=Pigmentiphaga kullae TaxID=151784 RepID=A0A4Q7NL50_9BURK|nr:tripartite tricarboxylate transporter substrate-binding protein [Pigmentiphaga kullae]RZS85844.1 tripartite-type tricarboxylate transporter receptor subunit TctC [Pigmentiphaga kullae]